jgi:ammonium transporter, Amt family
MTSIPGGWLNHNWIQLAYQLADSTSGFAYSFFGTYLILFLMSLIPGLSLRVPAEEEEMGLDEAQLGEFAYDYVELKGVPQATIFGEAKITNFEAGENREGVYSTGGSGRVSMEMQLIPVSLRDEEQIEGGRGPDVV